MYWPLRNLYTSRSCFLLCGGPSFAGLDHAPLRQPGILTMALNNAARSFRPQLWTGVDPPEHFIRSIWLDPTILKFTPRQYTNRLIFNSDAWQFMDKTVSQCPAVFHFDLAERFEAATFLDSESFMWGEPDHVADGGGSGGRSVMLPALRVLFELGIRRVFLLGCDFRMSKDSTYHFEQGRARHSVRNNLHSYAKLNRRFKELRPVFEAKGFEVLNCNPQSGLDAFEFIAYEEAIRQARAEFGDVDVENERTAGLYDTPKPRGDGGKVECATPQAVDGATPRAAEVGGTVLDR